MSKKTAATTTPNNNNNNQNNTGNQPLKRTLCVHIEGSLQSLGRQGTLAGLWKAVNGRESILFHPNLGETMTDDQHSNIINDLCNGVIKKLTVKEHQSTFPFTLGVDINCVPPNEVTNLGESFAYTVLPNSNCNHPQVVFECNASTEDNSNWHNLYSAWNASNLETHGVMDVPNQPFLFVHIDHPVIGLLRYNESLIGCNIDTQPKLEKEYFKIAKQVMAECCQVIRNDILNNMPTKDLNCFSVQIRRLNKSAWEDLDSNALLGFKYNPLITSQDMATQQNNYLKEYASKVYQYMARLEVEYELAPSNISSPNPT
jgi:hypothetical protein